MHTCLLLLSTRMGALCACLFAGLLTSAVSGTWKVAAAILASPVVLPYA